MCDKAENSEIRKDRSPQHIPSRFESPSTQGSTGYEMSDEAKLDEIFKHHPPTPFTGPQFETLREAARHFAKVVLMNVPRGADRTAAIRKIREAVMTANAGISLGGLSL